MTAAVRKLLGSLMPARILSDTSNQLFNPFLGTIAAGIGISNQQLGLLVSLRSLSGLTGPLFGAAADRRGHLYMARIGVLLMVCGLTLLGVSRSLLTTAMAMIPMGLALGMLNPVLQAYVSSQVEYGRRGRALGILEYSWALAGIVGLSGVGWLIATFGWRAAVFVLAGLLLGSLVAFRKLPAALSPGSAPGSRVAQPLHADRAVWASALAVGLTFFGFFNVMIIHGVWLTEAFAFTPTLLGVVALVLGLADLSGVTVVSLIADRVGPLRLALFASLFSAGVYLLPAVVSSLAGTVVALVLMRMMMQVTFVSLLPVMSELQPNNRGQVLGLAGAVGQVGMAIAAATGPWFYANAGPAGLGAGSAISAAATFAVLLLVRKRKETSWIGSL